MIFDIYVKSRFYGSFFVRGKINGISCVFAQNIIFERANFVFMIIVIIKKRYNI